MMLRYGIPCRKGAPCRDYFAYGKDKDCELYALCSLVRINGVGATAAKMLYAAGCRCPAEAAASDAETMLARIAADNASHQYYQGKLGVKDMQYCITMAGLLEALADVTGSRPFSPVFRRFIMDISIISLFSFYH